MIQLEKTIGELKRIWEEELREARIECSGNFTDWELIINAQGHIEHAIGELKRTSYMLGRQGEEDER